MGAKLQTAFGTQSSIVIKACQLCASADLKSVLFVGYLPPVNQMKTIGDAAEEETFYPAELFYCRNCSLVQLGNIVDARILFPPDYPYRSGTTQILKDNFRDLCRESTELFGLNSGDLVVDIGSNDGTLLSYFQKAGFQVQGIEPSEMGRLAIQNQIPTEITFFHADIARSICRDRGTAKLITATNVFAHMEQMHDVMNGILDLLDSNGIFVSESHYLMSLLATLQYDTIYHEHLRYYSLHSIQNLLNRYGLEVIHAVKIPTHGGSIRVYSARKGTFKKRESVEVILSEEKNAGSIFDQFQSFSQRMMSAKLKLYSLILQIKEKRGRIAGIGAPSRASTLIHYTGLDAKLIDVVCEVKGSYKIGKYMPGTFIPVVEESYLLEKQPEYALLFSWHIADELIQKIKARGFKGRFIVPLPEPKLI